MPPGAEVEFHAGFFKFTHTTAEGELTVSLHGRSDAVDRGTGYEARWTQQSYFTPPHIYLQEATRVETDDC